LVAEVNARFEQFLHRNYGCQGKGGTFLAGIWAREALSPYHRRPGQAGAEWDNLTIIPRRLADDKPSARRLRPGM
jgi:hypothetical protein